MQQKQPKFIKDKDPWLLAEDIPDIDLFFSRVWMWCFTNLFHRQTGRAYKKVLSVYRGYHQWFYFGEKDSFEVGEAVAKKFLKEPKFTEKVNKECMIWYKQMIALGKKIPAEKIKSLSDKHLLALYNEHTQVHIGRYEWGWIPVAGDMFHNNLTNRLKDYLRGLGVKEDQINPDLVTLTSPNSKSPIQAEQEELLKIAALAEKNNNKLSPATEKLLKAHYKKYYWTKYLFLGTQGVYDYAYYQTEIKRILSEGSPTKQLADIKTKFKEEVAKREALIKKLGVKGAWKTILDQWGGFMITKIYRRYGQIFLLYKMEFVLKEIARRHGLSLMQIRFMLPSEVNTLMKTGKAPKNLHERTKFCVYFTEKNFEKIYTGKEAERLAKQTERKVDHNVTQLYGQTGCPGYGKGRVKIVIRAEDMAKFEKGDILVSIATDPDIVPAMKKAAAIVTEQGGITSHAAIVSRELGVPCVIGTKIATKVLKDGDLVEVDANQGIVRKIN